MITKVILAPGKPFSATQHCEEKAFIPKNFPAEIHDVSVLQIIITENPDRPSKD